MLKLFLLCLLILLPPFAAQGKSCQKISVAAPSDWIPVAFIDKHQQRASGVGYDLIRHIAGQLGLEIEISAQLPWKRALQYLESGQLDVIAALYWTRQRARLFDYSQAYFHNEPRIFVLKEKVFPYQGLEDLLGLTGVIPSGGSFGEAFDDFAREHRLELQKVTDKKMMIRALTSGIADYYIQDHFDGLSYLKQQQLDLRIVALPVPISFTPVYFALSKKSPCSALLPQVNALIEKASNDGTLSGIIRRYSPLITEALKQ